MNIESFLVELRGLGVTFSVENGKLRSKSAKGALSPVAQAKIRERKDEIIAFLTAALSGGERDIPLVRVARDVPLPLSFAQQRLWFLDQLEPGSAFYNIPAAIRMRGALDEGALLATLEKIVARHESLRTTFAVIDGAPVQVIADRIELPIYRLDLSHLNAAEKEDAAHDALRAEGRKPFDLQKGPLLRMVLLKLAPQEHIFMAIMHHIVSDGWSMGVLVNEVATIYGKTLGKNLPPLPEMPIQYGDFAYWQRQWLTGKVLEQQLGYWQKRLSGAPALLELPTDRARPAVQGHAGGTVNFSIGEETTGALYALSKAGQATLFMTLAAAFSILLGRYAGQSDICLGTPIANRNRVETEPLIGFFLNTLVLRSEIDDGASFNALLKQVRAATLEAYDNQDVPFEQLVEVLKPERSAAYSPLFQVMLILQNTPMEGLELPGVILESVPVDMGTSKTDLRLSVTESHGGLSCSVEYRTDLFDASTIEIMGRHFDRLLRAVAADPEQQIGALPMRSAEEKQAIVQFWDGVVPGFFGMADDDLLYPLAHDNVLDCFSQAVLRDGAATAIRHRGTSMSYRELECAANRIANGLLAKGVNKGETVAIAMDDPVGQIAAMLGVLKAGAVFASINPALPQQRIVDLLQIVDPACTISRSDQCLLLADTLAAAGLRNTLLAPDRESADYPDTSVRVAASPDDPCYLYFTSGSTGKPKAVLGRIKGLAQFVQWEIAEFDLTSKSRVSQLTNPGFDVYLRDTFTPLACGATICIPEQGEILDPFALLAWLEREEVSLVHCVPTLFRTLLDTDLSASRLPALQYLLLAGEALLPADANRWIDIFGARARLVNLYGPTETTLAKFFYRLPAQAMEQAFVPVGRPMRGAQAVILDERLELCPPGRPGELCLRTPYRSFGYFRRPDLTEAAFIRNSLTRGNGDLLYRTGDLGLVLEDGNFRLLGRKDFQVKIRGMRIDLGEIESALARLPGVHEAVVVALNDAGAMRLVAYVVAAKDLITEANPTALREGATRLLPEHMIPAYFVLLDALPLSPNGKIDRKALPAPDLQAHDASYVEPRSDSERKLAQIWSEVLRRERVGVEDNFFAIGGHSLLATQVIARLPAAFQVELPLRALFEAPTIAALARRIEQVARRRDTILDAPIAPVARTGGMHQAFNLSFGQQRLWFLQQFESGSSIYNIPVAVRLRGRLNADVLSNALNEVVRRHEALRTTFAERDGQPVQLVAATLSLPIRHLQPVGATPEEREAPAMLLLQEEVQQPFDLGQGPLLRPSLLKLGDDEHIFLLVLHHIVTDSWSTGILIKELAQLYTAFLHGRASPLAELTIQYPDYAQWQRGKLEQGVLREQREYWAAQLHGSPALLTLPTDYPRTASRRHRGATLPFVIAAADAAPVYALAQETGSTLFMVLAAAFNILLARYAGQNDICIGTPIANRNRPEIAPVIGFFINTLVLRARVDERESFLSLLSRVRATALAAYANQDLPFEQLVDLLRPERNVGQSPLFQVMFSLQNTPQSSIALPGLSIEPLDSDATTAKFDLSLSVTEIEQRLYCHFEYDIDLFEDKTIRRMARHFQSLLSALAAAPLVSVANIGMLDREEMEQATLGWNRTDRHYDIGQTIHGRFEEQAAQNPQATALVCQGLELSYGALNAAANRVAHYLIAQGTQPDSPVGLCLERSFDLIIGMLGILKAGAAYLPLDPAYPKDRLAYMLADANPAVVLTQASLQTLLPAQSGLFFLDSQRELLQHYPEYNPQIGLHPLHLAYLIYTSGSTGKPKGIGITHGGANGFIESVRTLFDKRSLQRVLGSTSICFDLSVFEIFTPLSAGGSCWIVDNILDLCNGKHRYPVTLIGTVPSAIAELHRNDAMPETASTLCLGGEALSNSLVQELYARSSIKNIYNLYGPTEDSVYSTCALTRRGAQASCSIGHPVPNTQAYILDSQLNPVPLGVAGELFVAGDGTARGYVNRPDLSAEKFLPNPWSRTAGGRMYRTGDLVRRLEDGSIDYLGRIDFQVKVRGFRIELGEIEAALEQQPAVRQAVVLAKGEGSSKTLVAYVTRQNGAGCDLKAALRESLPDYMIPAHIVELDAMPLTPNGKVDRKALPEPDAAASGAAYVAPRSETESRLCRIWSDVLQLERVGVHDNFFDLGGHSLLATQAVSKIRGAFALDLPLRALFEAGTVAEMAQRVMGGVPEQYIPAAIVPVPRSPNMPLSHAQQRLWFLENFESGTALYNISGALRITGELDVDALRRAINTVTQRHEALRTTFPTVDGKPAQVIHPFEEAHWHLADLCGIPAAERAAKASWLAQDEAETPFDLARGPLARFKILRLQSNEHILLLTLHHIVTDGWSMGVLVKELTALYRAYAAGETSPLAPLAIQYADYAHWQHNWLAGEVLQRQMAYWTGQLQDAPAQLSLPFDRPRPAFQSHNGAVLRFSIDAGTSAAVAALCRETRSTLFMVLAASFNILLARYSGQNDICVGLPIANRNRAETEPLIGFFANTLVLRTQVDQSLPFTALLQSVRDTALAAYAHQDAPFEQLVEMLKPVRHTSHSPLFQVMFSLQNNPTGATEIPGLSVETLALEKTHSKYDLTLDMIDGGEQLSGSFEYNTDLFDEATIVRLSLHFQALLRSVSAAPDTRIFALTMLDVNERSQVLERWNDTARSVPTTTIHQLFEAQVSMTPLANALEFAGASLSYADLNGRANRLAHHLRSAGVRADSRVAICTERSLEMVVALLAVMKAGGAYVPLDPDSPAERLAYILTDAAPVMVLTQQGLLAGIEAAMPERALPVFCLDTAGAALAAYAPHNPEIAVQPENLAYVIYTSGSTGKPKGVLTTHANVVNLALAHIHDIFRPLAQERGMATQALRTSFNAPYVFDASVSELILLLDGHTLVIVPEEVRRSPEELLQFFSDSRLDAFDSSPAQLRYLLEYGGGVGLPGIVLFGGEAIDGELWATLRKLTGTRFFNAYGPTECTVDVALHDLSHEADRPLIGRPQANSQLYVLDLHLCPVPVGVAGELYIAGAGLARGYLNRPDLTAGAFIPNPFGSTAGARMYRSGDMARFLSDGRIEYLGRADDQVKIRGYRIELGEVEAALRVGAGVRDATVGVLDGEDGASLLAHVVREAGFNPPFLEGNELCKATESDALLLSGQFTAAWEIECGQQTVALLAPAHVPVISDEQARQYRVYPLSSMPYCRPDFDALHVDAWPKYFDGAPVLKKLWGKMYDRFPHTQMLIKETIAATVGIGNAVPLAWDGSAADLPKGWDGALERALAQEARGTAPNTLVVLAGIIDAKYKDRKAARLIVDAFKALACSLGMARLVVALRPIAKTAQQTMSIAAYSKLTNQDDRLFDGWLRLHCNAGGVVLASEEQSQYVEGSIAEWQQWSGKRFERSGTHFLDDTLAAIEVDLENDCARYYDPCIWVEHPLVSPASQPAAAVISAPQAAALYRQHTGRTPQRAIVIDQPNVEEMAALRGGSGLALLTSLARYAGRLPGASELKAQLARSLPAYMIPAHIVFIDKLPLTQSGKIDRKALPAPGASTVVDDGYAAPSSEKEHILCEIWASALGLSRVGVNDNFFTIGGDSILSIRVIAKARQSGLAFTTRDMFQHQTVKELARHASLAQDSAAPQHAVEGDAPLLPIQLAFLEEENEWHHFNQSLLLEAPADFDAQLQRDVVAALLARHDALRLRFVRQGDEWHSSHQPLDAGMLDRCIGYEDLRGLDEEHWRTALATRGEAVQAGLSLAHGPLFRAVWFDAEAGRGRLLVVAHHLVVDGVSWRILLKDLEQAYRQRCDGKPIALERKTSSYQQWGRFLQTYAQSRALRHELPFWIDAARNSCDSLPAGRTVPDNSFAATAKLGVALDAAATQLLLTGCHHVYRTQINDLLLAGLVIGLADWAHMKRIRIDLEGHGREELSDAIDLSETVGWFTSLYSVTLDAGERVAGGQNADVGAIIRSVRERLRCIPRKGIGYGVLRYLSRSDALAATREDMASSIVFNYLGQFGAAQSEGANEADTAFAVAAEFAGERLSRALMRTHALGFNGGVLNGSLSFDLDYNRHRYSVDEMQALAHAIESGWHAVIKHCSEVASDAFAVVNPVPGRASVEAASIAQTTADFSFNELVAGTAPLLPNNYLFFGRKDLNHWNASDLLEVLLPYGPALLERAVGMLLEHHDGLRRLWKREEGSWTQHFLLPSELAPWWSVVDLSHLPDGRAGAEIERVCADAQRSLQVDRILFHAIYFDLGPQRNARLMFVAHHLLLDAFSSPILIEDLERVCAALQSRSDASAEAVLPPKTTSMKRLAQILHDYAQQPAVASDIANWRALPWDNCRNLPVELQRDELIVDSETAHPHTIADCLNAEDTAALEQIPLMVPGITVEDVVLAALVRSYGAWSGTAALVVAGAHNGRSFAFDEEIDLSRTVGWCTNLVCHVFDLTQSTDAISAVEAVQQRRLAVRGKESHYSLLRYMHADETTRHEMNAFPEAQLEFYHVPRMAGTPIEEGRTQRGFARAAEDAGPNDGPMHAGFRPFGFGNFHGDRFWIRWTYCRTAYGEETWRSFLGNFLQELRGLVSELSGSGGIASVVAGTPLERLENAQ